MDGELVKKEEGMFCWTMENNTTQPEEFANTNIGLRLPYPYILNRPSTNAQLLKSAQLHDSESCLGSPLRKEVKVGMNHAATAGSTNRPTNVTQTWTMTYGTQQVLQVHHLKYRSNFLLDCFVLYVISTKIRWYSTVIERNKGQKM